MDAIRKLLSRWIHDAEGARIESLGSHGGLSGAMFWRVATSGQLVGLRRWPKEHPTADRLIEIHGLLKHLSQADIDSVPVPRAMDNGATYLRQSGYLWELSPWMPGEADDSEQPNSARLAAAMTALAQLHLAASSYSPGKPIDAPTPSVGLGRRQQALDQLQQGELQQVRSVVSASSPGALREIAAELVEVIARVLDQVAADARSWSNVALPQQWCLRDVWKDHILFQQDRVSGIVDFGAVGVESVAGDLARLLGSLVSDEPTLWKAGMEVYEKSRPLTADERSAVGLFDSTGLVLSAANWLRWLFLGQRKFADTPGVLARMHHLGRRLEYLAQSGGASVAFR